MEKLNFYVQRLYDRAGGTYLITVYAMEKFQCSAANPGAAMPQARAVLDDFGFLTIVNGWY